MFRNCALSSPYRKGLTAELASSSQRQTARAESLTHSGQLARTRATKAKGSQQSVHAARRRPRQQAAFWSCLTSSSCTRSSPGGRPDPYTPPLPKSPVEEPSPAPSPSPPCPRGVDVPPHPDHFRPTYLQRGGDRVSLV